MKKEVDKISGTKRKRRSSNTRNAESKGSQFKKGSTTDGKNGKVSKPNSVDNDPSWYSVYPDLVRSTGRISTGYPIGINYGMSGDSSTDFSMLNDVHTMRLNYIHGIGVTENDRDPVNLAATKLYSYVRHANSGHANYERSDLMLYLLSVIEVYNWIALGMRAYGTINLFNNLNRALPKHVITAMGWDYASVAENSALLRTYINNAIARVNSLYVPTEMNITRRWWWLNSNVFTDDLSPKAMFYVFTQRTYRTYEELEGAGYLKAHEVSGSLNVSTWKSNLDDMLDKLLDSEDIGIISGDILKAYGERVFTLSMVPEDYVTPFIYSEEALAQINNATIIGAVPTNLDITQEVSENLNSGLRYKPTVTFGSANHKNAIAADPIMSFNVEDPDDTTVMIASRFITTLYEIDNDTYECIPWSGSELVYYENIYTTTNHVAFTPSFVNANPDVRVILDHFKFDKSPLVKYFDETTGTVTVSTTHYDNVVPVRVETIARLHDTALLSLFTALV